MKNDEKLVRKAATELFDWIDAHGGQEPSGSSKNATERRLANWLKGMRAAKLADAKAQLLAMAARGEPKPSPRSYLGKVLAALTTPPSKRKARAAKVKGRERI